MFFGNDYSMWQPYDVCSGDLVHPLPKPLSTADKADLKKLDTELRQELKGWTLGAQDKVQTMSEMHV